MKSVAFIAHAPLPSYPDTRFLLRVLANELNNRRRIIQPMQMMADSRLTDQFDLTAECQSDFLPENGAAFGLMVRTVLLASQVKPTLEAGRSLDWYAACVAA